MKHLFEINDEIFVMKNMLRKGWLIRNVKSKTGRVESVAEHCFSTCMLALEIINKEKRDIDQLKVLKMILYHEIGEIDVGDITPHDNIPLEEKHNRELEGVKRISKAYNMPEILELWLEYEEQKTEEAKFVKMVDKLDAVIQSKIYSRLEEKESDIVDEFAKNAVDAFPEAEKYVEYIKNKK